MSMHDEVWKSLGQQDADWAVESRADRKHGGWANDLDEFYATGRAQVAKSLERLPDQARGAALDYGAGTGRLSFALATEYDRVTALDVAESMQAILRERAAERGIANVSTSLVADYEPHGEHDYALSLITMQHFANRAAVAAAISAMLHAVRVGGYVYFEVPVKPNTWKARLQPRLQAYRLLRRLGVSPETLHARGLSGISMLCAPREWIDQVVRASGGSIERSWEEPNTFHLTAFYLAQRVS